MANQNNPAGRLYEILREAKRQPETSKIQTVWAAVFGIAEGNISRVLYHLILLSDLLDSAEKEIRAAQVNHEVYLRHFPALKRAVLATNLDAPWRDCRSGLTEDVLGSLEFCSELLERTRPERQPSTEEINNLRTEVDRLVDAVEKSQVAPEVKTVLLDLLQSMQTALAEYRIHGVNGMRSELFSILERLQRHFSDISEERDKPEVGAFLKVLQWWDALTSACVNTQQILGGFCHLLTGGGSTS